MPILTWRLYADHQVVSLGRSWGGTFMPIPEWLHMGDHQHTAGSLVKEDAMLVQLEC